MPYCFVLTWLFLCACALLVSSSSFRKDTTSFIRLGFHYMFLLIVITLLKHLFPNTVPLRIGVSIYVFWRDKIQFITKVAREGFSEMISEPRPKGQEGWKLEARSSLQREMQIQRLWCRQLSGKFNLCGQNYVTNEHSLYVYVYTYRLMNIHTHL